MPFVVTPWSIKSEWSEVMQLVTGPMTRGRFAAAIRRMKIWQARIERLPAGVETTICLMQAILVCQNKAPCPTADIGLTAATAINRFLNLVTHTGFNLFGFTKYYDVAERLSIPDWVVEVRHETTHGHMPSDEVLLDALAFSFDWIKVNYWLEPAEEEEDGDGSDYFEEAAAADKDRLHDVLDCYKYLKLFTLWGGMDTLNDLRDHQPDIYSLVLNTLLATPPGDAAAAADDDVGASPSTGSRSLQLKKGCRKPQKRTEEGLRGSKVSHLTSLVRNEVHSFVSGLGRDSSLAGKLFRTLVHDELLLPGRDFVKSLLGDDDDSCSRNLPENGSRSRVDKGAALSLPKDLIRVWSEVLQMMTAIPQLLPMLLEELHSMAGDSVAPHWQRQLAAEWIREICVSVLQSGAKSDASAKSSVRDRHPAAKVRSNMNLGSSVDVAGDEWQDGFLASVVSDPKSEMALVYLNQVLELVQKPRPVSAAQARKIVSLVEELVGAGLDMSEDDHQADPAEVKTITDLAAEPNQGRWQKMDASSSTAIDWTQVPFGVSPYVWYSTIEWGLDVARFSRVSQDGADDETLLHLPEVHDEVRRVNWREALSSPKHNRLKRRAASGSVASSSKKKRQPFTLMVTKNQVPLFYR